MAGAGDVTGASAADPRPPRPPFVFSVGITGHRIDALPADTQANLRTRLRDLLALIERTALDLRERERDCFGSDPPRLRLVSPLADGADQLAADAALEFGWEIEAVLPFGREYYRSTLANDQAREAFDALLGRSSCVLELPGEQGNETEGYAMAGRATVAHCDLLIAVWDGLKARGRGGTAEVVELAITRGTPVIHIPSDSAMAERLLWAAFDPVVDTQGDDPMAERSLDPASIEQVLGALLVPPSDPQERKFLARFETERLGKVRARIEYPLLLAIAGVKRFDRRRFVEKTLANEIEEEWRQYRADWLHKHEIAAPLELLEGAYSWTDRLATRFAQTYRSGHIFNFVLGGFAICFGLSGFMAPAHKVGLAAFEFAITLGILLNTYLGTRNEWHRRWLDYRQLAERLRPMRSLKLLGIAAPDSPGTKTYPVPERWIDWYAMAAWRTMGCPSGRISPERARQLAAAVADHEISPQVNYHVRNSQQIELLDHRLDLVGMGLFFATLLVSIATLIGLAVGSYWVNTLSNWFTLVSAGFPALGTAIFGIRYQGDFGATANRSQNTAVRLKAIDEELRKRPVLSRTADLTEEAARVMLGDLDEWSLLNQQHDLSV